MVDVGPNAHSVSDHTQGNWNGILGDISIRVDHPLTSITSVTLDPNAADPWTAAGVLELKLAGQLPNGVAIYTPTQAVTLPAPPGQPTSPPCSRRPGIR